MSSAPENASKNTDALAREGGSARSSGARIVVFTGGGIGDALFHIPHFLALAARSDSGKIFLACKKGREIASLFEGVSFVEEVVGMADDQRESGKVDLFRATAKFRSLKVNEAWLFHDSATMLLAAALAGVERRYGWSRGPSPFTALLTRNVDVSSVRGHPPMFERAEILLKTLGVVIDPAARFHPAVEALAEAETWLKGRRAIAFGLNASEASKQWGGVRFGALAARLAQVTDACFLLFGAGDVTHEAEITIATSALPPDRFVDLTRMKSPLGRSFAALSRCGFYVGNDSSGLNLAVSAGMMGIGLFGTTQPLSHSGRILPIDGDFKGMDAIDVNRVFNACREQIARLGWPAPDQSSA